MERGYWLPPCAKNLAVYAGFYIDSEAVYQGNVDSGWNRLLEGLCQKLTGCDRSFQKRCEWMGQPGRNRFVILKNEDVEVIAEDADFLPFVVTTHFFRICLLLARARLLRVLTRSFPLYLPHLL